MHTEKAERITITLPPDMLSTIKTKVSSGAYASTSEVIREAMRVWEKHEEEREMRISLIRKRLADSIQSGPPVPIDEAFKTIERLHLKRMKKQADEEI